jgi:hypothetical protein
MGSERMSVPPIPPEFDHLSHRPFSFYPPVLNIEHNEWLLRRSTWSEILVANCKTDQEVWIPRRFIGEVSRVDEPVMIVGLTKELEYKGGTVWPHERRVIRMPRAVNEGVSRKPPENPEVQAPVVGIRLEPSESRISRLIGAVLLAGVLVCVLVVVLSQRSISFRAIEQFDLGLTADDDYHSIVRKLGTPSEDRWRSETGELQYRLLRFPARPYTLILMGTDRDHAHYVGALDAEWKPVHSVRLPDGNDTRAMLKKLAKW